MTLDSVVHELENSDRKHIRCGIGIPTNEMPWGRISSACSGELALRGPGPSLLRWAPTSRGASLDVRRGGRNGSAASRGQVRRQV